MSVQDNAVLQITSSYHTLRSSVIQNVWHMRVEATAPASESLVEIACETFLENVFNNIEVHLTADIPALDFAVDEMQWNALAGRWDILRRIAEDTVSGFVPSGATDAMPAGVAALIEFLPVYRRNRGYKYLSGFCEGDNQLQGQINATLTTALANLSLDVMGEYTIETGVSSMFYVILNRSLGVMNDPNAAVIKGDWAYQRRRKYLVGA